MTCGVYRILNKETGKQYIGSSLNIEQRWKDHLKRLKTGKHENRYLQRAWNKYGEPYFLFEIIEVCSPEVVRSKEELWISKEGVCNKKLGYNLSETAYRITSYKFTDEQKERQKYVCAKPVYQYNAAGQFIAQYFSVSEASRQTKLFKAAISACATKKTKTAGGFYWRYTFAPVIEPEIAINPNAKIVDCFNLAKQHLATYKSLHYAQRATKVGRKEIKGCCEGKTTKAGGYLWQYKTEIPIKAC